ncbi:MAG: SDR family oxidoreductase [Nitrososphaerota archaeon]|nr:SDR family oxidoreductase [Nitrososphaerota archaeon]
MSRRFDGRNAIVTGATSGIGESIARRLASEAATVAIVGRRAEKGEEVARSIAAHGGRAFFVRADVRDSESVAEMTSVCLDRFGGSVSILVNNAGVSKGNATMEHVNEDDWDAVMDTNAKGTFLCSKAVIPVMIKNGGGSIVNVSSGGGLRGYVGGSAYSASKAAVIMLTKVLAMEHGKEKIRANCICPGSVHSEMFDGGIKNFEKKMVEQGKPGLSTSQIMENIARGIPIGRIGEPEDVANLALFLSSDEASFISGSVVVIDGGQCL